MYDCVSTIIPSLPACPIGQAVWEDDGTLQWELWYATVGAALLQISRG